MVKKKLTARTADINQLYEESVQCPEFEVGFIKKLYKKYNKSKCTSLREDFSASALISTEWVMDNNKHTSIAVDYDKQMINQAKKTALRRLDQDQQSRMKICYGDSSKYKDDKVDCVLAANFSYFVFKDRINLIKYFQNARSQLKRKGLFLLDAFGGYEAHQLLEERTRHKDFTYVWDQSSFNPITHEIKCYIHFEFPDKTKKKRAFTYDWRLWTLPEIQECLKEAGFKSVDIYMQGWDDKKDEETEEFYKMKKCDADPAWVAYLVARK